MSKKLDPTHPVFFPAVVTIDTREQTPFAFDGLFADARDGGGPLVVETARGTLQSGDYSLSGLEGIVAIERKSLADLYSTVGQGRDRFVRELARLHDMRFAAVVVEADWSIILHSPPPFSKLSPKIIFRSILAWQQEFPNVHWNLMSDRRLAEITTLRILERAWKNEMRRKAKSDCEPIEGHVFQESKEVQ